MGGTDGGLGVVDGGNPVLIATTIYEIFTLFN